jgi:molybdopterin-binding protein
MDAGAMMRAKITAGTITAVVACASVVALSLPAGAAAVAPPVVSSQAQAANAAFLAYAPTPA